MTLHACTCKATPRLVIDAGGKGWYVHCPNCEAMVSGPTEHNVVDRWNHGSIVIYQRIAEANDFGNAALVNCCLDTRNMQLVSPVIGVVIWKCRVCGRQHHRMDAEAGRFGVHLG